MKENQIQSKIYRKEIAVLKATSLYLDNTIMEGGIYIQEVTKQRKMVIERGSIDICGEMIGTKNSKIYTRDHTTFYSIEKIMTDCD